MAKKPMAPEELAEDEEKEAEGAKRRRGGRVEKKEKHVERKRGGRVPGKKSEHRPDRRARGGGVGADKSPFTEASKMSSPAFERKDRD